MISIIIPTYWKRVELAFQNANQINSYKCFDGIDLEILIIDTSEIDFSHINTHSNIKYYNLDLNSQNSLCIKRNFGASKSSGETLIFLDDDVIPDLNYFNFVLRELKSNQVICGNIFFPKERVKQLPLVKYKESRHRIVEQRFIKNGELKFNNFVAMCFAINKDTFFDFDINYNKYGFEDIDYGRQLEAMNVKILLSLSSEVIHLEESTTLLDYKKKLYSCSRYMFPYYNKKHSTMNKFSIVFFLMIGFFTKIFSGFFFRVTNFLLNKNFLNSVSFYQIIVFAEGYFDYVVFDLLIKNKKQNNEFI